MKCIVVEEVVVEFIDLVSVSDSYSPLECIVELFRSLTGFISLDLPGIGLNFLDSYFLELLILFYILDMVLLNSLS